MVFLFILSLGFFIGTFRTFLLFLHPINIMGRIIGIDYGTKRIGLAVTDPLQIFPSPLDTVKPKEFFGYIDNYLKTEPIDEFVIGYQMQMNNKPIESFNQIIHLIKRHEYYNC